MQENTAEPVQFDSSAILLRSLTRARSRLGEIGAADEASRIAAKTWSELRHGDAIMAEKINGTMHYLARLPDEVQAAKNHKPKS